MKLLPIVLINVATVCVALFAYEQLRTEPEPRAVAVDSDAHALVKRIEALESRGGRPLLRAKGPDPVVAKRLATLEEAVGVLGVTGTPAAPSEGEEAQSEGTPAKQPAPTFEPTPEAIMRFRKLREAVNRQDRQRKNRARINKLLDRLSLNLNDRQRDQILEAHGQFQPRVREIWTEVKQEATRTIEDGGEIDRGEIVSSTQARIQQEFAATINSVVSQTEAEEIARALHRPDK